MVPWKLNRPWTSVLKKIIKTITFQQKPLPKEPIWAGIEGRLVPAPECDVAPFLPPPKMLGKIIKILEEVLFRLHICHQFRHTYSFW